MATLQGRRNNYQVGTIYGRHGDRAARAATVPTCPIPERQAGALQPRPAQLLTVLAVSSYLS